MWLLLPLSALLELEFVLLSRSEAGGVRVIVFSGTRFSVPFLMFVLLLLLLVPLLVESDEDELDVLLLLPLVGSDFSGLAGSR